MNSFLKILFFTILDFYDYKIIEKWVYIFFLIIFIYNFIFLCRKVSMYEYLIL